MAGEEQSCKGCQASFVVAAEDIQFYEKVSPVFNGQKFLIPPPDHCPACREQLRMSWKNERKLYQRTCGLCQKPTLAIYSQEGGYTPYCPDCYWGDGWDPLSYGREYDPSRPFFDQLSELLREIPKQALHHNQNENCPYTTSTTRNRNCYLISSSGINEDCYYGIFLKSNRDSVDNTHIIDSELCYECLDSTNGYNLRYSQNTNLCVDSAFLYDCSGCKNCFFSYGLRNKEYVFANEQLTKEEYQAKLSQINFGSYAQIQDLKAKFAQFIEACPRLYYEGQNNEDVVASNHIFNSRNCSHCIDSYNLEDCKYCGWLNDSKDCQDVYSFGYRGVEQNYQCMEVGDTAFHLLFSLHCWNSNSELTYCYDCHGTQHLFGCVGVQRKEYCVLNRQYSEDEYQALCTQIIGDMVRRGEWGQFLPTRYSPFGYNETMADDLYPLSKDAALASGWLWREEDSSGSANSSGYGSDSIPDLVGDVPDSILNKPIICDRSGRPFKVLKQELKFYRDQNIPLPRLHPDLRHKARFALRNPRRFAERACDGCKTSLLTSYRPGDGKTVYCERCYLSYVHG